MNTTSSSKDATSTTNGSMPATDSIPEIPEHPLCITHEMSDELELRYITSGHERVAKPEYKHLVVRCSICGYETVGVGISRKVAWEDQNMHFATMHVGSKKVWHPDDIPNEEPPFVGDCSYTYHARGDISDKKAAKIALKRLDRQPSAVLIAHRPPATPFPGSPEADSNIELREVRV